MITRGGGTKAGDYQRDAPPALLHGPLVFFTPISSAARPDLRVTLLGDETWILLTGDHAQLHERRRAHELRGCDNASSSQQGHTNTCCLRPPPTGLSRAMDGSDDYV